MDKFINKVICGDCLIKLKELEDNSIDSIVTDPPYELGFMGKSWDNTGIANKKEMWSECLRVLKPGGHLLAFSGTRTYHRMASAIEDAGFEVRDMIEWVYGSGFPKSLNIGKSVNQLETNEWSKIGKALDNIDQKSIIEIWKSNSNNVKIVETQSLKNQIIVGQDTLSENFVVLNVVQNSNQENSNLLVSFAEQNLNEVQAINTKINTALPSVEAEIRQLQDNVKSAEQQSQNQNHKSWSIFTAQCDVKEWLKENTMVNHKVDEALKTLRGKKKYSNEEITNVLCAVIPITLKLTILNQSKTFQNLDTNQKMECVSAINVIITEYTAESLISNTVAILKSKAVDKLQGNKREIVGETRIGKTSMGDSSGWDTSENMKAIKESGLVNITKGTSEWEGWGTALKPAHEPICMARKPLDRWWKIKDDGKKIMGRVMTVAENVLKWGTGGINIDESRVGTEDTRQKTGGAIEGSGWGTKGGAIAGSELGRFPANLLHDNSEEVRECFPDTKSGKMGPQHTRHTDGSPNGIYGKFDVNHELGETYGDSGNASRFFRAIPQVVDYNDFLIYNRSILTNIKQLCGQHLTKKKTDTILDGVIQEAERFIQDAELLIFGNSKMEKFLTDTASTIKTLIAQMTELKTLNVLPNWLIMKFTEDYEKTIKLLKELNTEDVKNAGSINRLIAFKREMLELIRDIARNVVIENYENGKLQTENELMLTPENINENTKKNIGERKSFKSIIYQAKASKSERNKGCEGLEEKPKVFNGQSDKPSTDMKDVEKRFTTLPKANNHPTVKPIALCEYLIKMVTKPGGIVLDPFAGSGSTLVAAKQNGYKYIGIELTEEYIPIIEARLSGVENDLFKDIL